MAEAKHSTRAVRTLRIYCPIDRETLAGLMAGRAAVIEQDRVLGPMLDIVRGDTLLGDFGTYTAVVELAPGWELFTPGPAARPALGEAGASTVSPTAILTLHIPGDADEAAVARAIDAILGAHPWEVPVIELGETRLVVRLPVAPD
jgi:hypothetical protein